MLFLVQKKKYYKYVYWKVFKATVFFNDQHFVFKQAIIIHVDQVEIFHT